MARDLKVLFNDTDMTFVNAASPILSASVTVVGFTNKIELEMINS